MSKENETESESHAKHIHRGRDVWTNRVIGWATGALVPILLLLIPLVTRYMDDAKEVEKLRISVSETLINLKARVAALENDLEFCKRSCVK